MSSPGSEPERRGALGEGDPSMSDAGVVHCDGLQLEWVSRGSGMPMMIFGTHRYYRRAFPAALRDHFEMVFCDSRQWAATPPGFDLTTITGKSLADDLDA